VIELGKFLGQGNCRPGGKKGESGGRRALGPIEEIRHAKAIG